MNRTAFLCVVATGALLVLQPAADVAIADSPNLDIPFGTLVSDSSCAAATHMILSPCPPQQPQFYVVFPRGRNLERFEGKNVAVRGTVDQTACPLPLILAKRIVLSKSLPPCPN